MGEAHASLVIVGGTAGAIRSILWANLLAKAITVKGVADVGYGFWLGRVEVDGDAFTFLSVETHRGHAH